MVINIEGRGDYTLTLTNGSLIVEFEGSVILQTIGNPSKLNNTNFVDLAEAEAYFRTLPLAQPVLIEEGI